MAKKPTSLNQNNDPQSGFGLGVLLGATIGAGTAIMLQTKEGKHLAKKVYVDLKKQGVRMQKQHPKQAKKLKDLLSQALEEARSTQKEIRQVAKKATKKAHLEAQKRRFISSGKPLKRSSSDK